MSTTIGVLHVRRSIFIDASPTRVWREFESAQRIKRWLDRGHTIHEFEPSVGGHVEMSVEFEGEHRHFGGAVRHRGLYPRPFPGIGREPRPAWLGSAWEWPCSSPTRPTPARAPSGRRAAASGGTPGASLRRPCSRGGQTAAQAARAAS